MKDLLIGMVVGVVTGYVLRKMEDDGNSVASTQTSTTSLQRQKKKR